MSLPRVSGVSRVRKKRIGGAIPFKHAMRPQPLRSALCFHLLWRLTKCQRLRLSENICEQHVMMAAQRIERLPKANEVAGNDAGALMDQLIKRVLAVGPGFTPVDGTCVVTDCFSIERDMLPVAFHR